MKVKGLASLPVHGALAGPVGETIDLSRRDRLTRAIRLGAGAHCVLSRNFAKTFFALPA